MDPQEGHDEYESKIAPSNFVWDALFSINFDDQFLAPKTPKFLIEYVDSLIFDNDFWPFGDHFFDAKPIMDREEGKFFNYFRIYRGPPRGTR